MSQLYDDDIQFVKIVKDADPLIIISDSDGESVDGELRIVELERFLFCMIGIIIHYFYFSDSEQEDDNEPPTIPSKSQMNTIMKTIKMNENQFGQSSCFIEPIEKKLGRKFVLLTALPNAILKSILKFIYFSSFSSGYENDDLHG